MEKMNEEYVFLRERVRNFMHMVAFIATFAITVYTIMQFTELMTVGSETEDYHKIPLLINF